MLDRYLVIEYILFIIILTFATRYAINQNNKPKTAVRKIHNRTIKDHLNKYIA